MIWRTLPLHLGVLVFAIFLPYSAQADVSSHAKYSVITGGYELVLRDKRRLMAHDIGSLFHNTYIVESHIRIPSLVGTFDVKDIQIFEVETIDGKINKYNRNIVSGSVVIQNSAVTVNLQKSLCPKPDCTRPYEFNGTYHLHENHAD